MNRLFFNRLGFKFVRADIINKDQSTYMRRWILTFPNSAMLRLHHIMTSDTDRGPHDHPFDFWSMLLTGSYFETIYTKFDKFSFLFGHTYERKPWRIRYVQAETLHKLWLDRPIWTLVLTGPRRRAWGFQTPDGWIPWRQYHYGTVGVSSSSEIK